MTRIVGNYICKDCCYFEPEQSVCQVDTIYEYKQPSHKACRFFTSDAPDYEPNIQYDLNEIIDEDIY